MVKKAENVPLRKRGENRKRPRGVVKGSWGMWAGDQFCLELAQLKNGLKKKKKYGQ